MAKCQFIDATCHFCGKTGHIAPACRAEKRGEQRAEPHGGKSSLPAQSKANYVEADETPTDQDELHMFAIWNSKPNPLRCEVIIEGTPLTMEMDTGASVSIISDGIRSSRLPDVTLTETNVVLKTYTSEPL